MRKKWTRRFLAAALSITMTVPGNVTALAATQEIKNQTETTQESSGEDYAKGEALVKVNESFYDQKGVRNSGMQVKSQAVTFDVLMELPAEKTEGTTQDGASVYGVQEEQILLAKSENLSTEELIASIEDYDGVEYAEPNYVITAYDTGDDDYLEDQWHLKDQGEDSGKVPGGTNVSALWNEGVTGAAGKDEIVVAILDTGIDYNHEDLKDQIDRNLCHDFTSDYELDPSNPNKDDEKDDVMDQVGHGTHVAGIIGACGGNGIGVSGINKQVTLSALQVLANDGYGYNSWGILAYQYMIDQKEQGVNYVAANNSWGGEGVGRSIQEAVDAAGEAGIVSVFASGNETMDRDATSNSPSGGTEMSLTVNASDENAAAAYFSNYGQKNTTLYAPGVDIFSTVIKADAVYEDREGQFQAAELDTLFGQEGRIKAYKADGDGIILEAAPEIENLDVKDGSLCWTLAPTKEEQLSYEMGVELTLGDWSAYKEYPYFSLKAMVEDDNESGSGRYTNLWVKKNNGDYEKLEIAVPYGKEEKNAVNLSEIAEGIDWKNFTVRIGRRITKNELSANLTYTVSQIGLSKKMSPYNLMSGTSMASPVVAGAVALLAAKYGQPDLATEEKKTVLMQEISARITGGVTRMDAMKDNCVSGGYLNLKKAVNDPYPVLQNFTQTGSQAVIEGYFFGKEKGTLSLDGTAVNVSAWTDNRITFTLPTGTKEAEYEFKVIRGSASSDYGRGWFVVEKVEGTTALSDSLYENLPVPAYEEMEIPLDLLEQESDYSAAALDGKFYVMVNQLVKFEEKEDDTYYPVILAYDEKTGKWSKKVLTQLPYSFSNDTVSVKLVPGENTDQLYLLETRGDMNDNETQNMAYKIYRYLPQENKIEAFGETKIREVVTYNNSYIYSENFIWVIGGVANLESGLEAKGTVMRFDLSRKQWEEMPSLSVNRYSPLAGVVNGKLIVTGGTDSDGKWVSQTEIWNAGQNRWESSASFPEIYANQSISAASGTYGSQMIVAGMFQNKNHTADTYVFDAKENKWSVSKKKVADTKVYNSAGAVLGDYFYVYGVTTPSNNAKTGFYRVKVSDLLAEGQPSSGQPSVDSDNNTPADTSVGAVTMLQSVSGKKSIQLSWAVTEGVSGYQVCRYNNKTKQYQVIANTPSASYVDSGLKKATNYRYKVRAYKTIGGQDYYGADTAEYKILTTTDAPTKVSARRTSASKIAVSYKPAAGSKVSYVYVKEQYQKKNTEEIYKVTNKKVYRYNKASGKYKYYGKVSMVKGKEIVILPFGKGKYNSAKISVKAAIVKKGYVTQYSGASKTVKVK